MKTLPFALTICASLFLAVCNGSAQANAAIPVAGSTQTNLAHLIANADHIVITNRLAAFEEKYRAFSLTISGDGARNIVRTVSFAKPRGACLCFNSWDMKFYRETNFLADVELGEDLVVFEGQWYKDDSGVLKRFDSELWKQIKNR